MCSRRKRIVPLQFVVLSLRGVLVLMIVYCVQWLSSIAPLRGQVSAQPLSPGVRILPEIIVWPKATILD
jgi:hypothetical protein